MPDVTELIASDHREVESLIAQFKQDRSKTTAMTLCTELDAHAAAEEKVFYPVMRNDVPDGTSFAGEGEHEYSEARQIIGRIKNTRTSSTSTSSSRSSSKQCHTT